MEYYIWPRRNEYPGENVTVFQLAPGADYSTWLKQNDAQPEDCIEGVLQDSCLYYCRNGIAAVFEHYLNANSSDFKVFFARYDTAGARRVWSIWEEAADAAAEEA